MKLTKRGETVKYWLYAALMLGLVATAFVAEGLLFGSAV